MPKTLNHGLWGSLAVAGLAAAVQTTRHNSKSAELESTKRLLKIFWTINLGEIFKKLCDDGDVEFPDGVLDEMIVRAMELTKTTFAFPFTTAEEETCRYSLILCTVISQVARIHQRKCTFRSDDAADRLDERIAHWEKGVADTLKKLSQLAALHKQNAASSPGTMKAADPQDTHDHGQARL